MSGLLQVYKAYLSGLGMVAVKVQLRTSSQPEKHGHEAVADAPHCLHLLGYTVSPAT